MSPRLRNILIITLLVAVVVTLNIVRLNSTMRGIESKVVCDPEAAPDALPMLLLSPSDVDSLITTAFPNICQTDVKDIPRKAVRETLRKNPYVLDADVSLSAGGKLMVQVTLRRPVARLFYGGGEYYLSRQGTLMPLSTKHYCHLLVANSQRKSAPLTKPETINLSDTSFHNRPADLLSLWVLCTFLCDNPKYGDIYDQATFSPEGDLLLTPKLGDITVEVGDTTNLPVKFSNLMAFFDQGVSLVGWDTYSKISVKWNDQVVGTRRE